MKNKVLGAIPDDKKEWARRLKLAEELNGMTVRLRPAPSGGYTYEVL